ncbi:hypothetical protein [Streptomyces monomycini]|uniref:hypothetical protein n=1 Tax=Streptomyces monomycini TaxID=371720 RepID=UPI0012FE8D8F|nr:hypothetical protein [Streptomyces monomycini]
MKRKGTQRKVFVRGGGKIHKDDADHLIDLQLGGRDEFSHLWALDKSVNRSLGSQIMARIKQHGLKPGDKIKSVTIK